MAEVDGSTLRSVRVEGQRILRGLIHRLLGGVSGSGAKQQRRRGGQKPAAEGMIHGVKAISVTTDGDAG